MTKQDLTKLSHDELFTELAKIVKENPELSIDFAEMLQNKIRETFLSMIKQTFSQILEKR